MRSAALARIVVTIAFLGGSAPASATLLQADLLTPGDGLITHDPNTGLQWLDVTATLDLSWDDVRSDVGGWFGRGFRHATFAEVCNLFISEGFQGQECLTAPDATDAATLGRVQNLQSLLGVTGGGAPEAQANTDGIYDQNGGPETGGLRTTPAVNPVEARLRMSSRSPLPGERSPTTGHYLVLVVPEPGTALLHAAGFVVLGAWRVRGRR